jgi:NADPH:quinone reductase-like Zn-dependent oxidoreductase
MRAWRVHQYGPHRDVLSLEDIPPPDPPPDGAVVEVAAAGLNFPDLLAIAGQYQVRAPLSFTPGFEAAGVVRAVGPGSRHRVGDRVVTFAPWGAFAEQVAAVDDALLPWPAPLTAAGPPACWSPTRPATSGWSTARGWPPARRSWCWAPPGAPAWRRSSWARRSARG